jgi:organic hydroperoxide reductase OsmC/OhrA
MSPLAPGRPIVLVIEDVHWADEVTLDVLWIVGRRVADRSAVLVMTYRDGEVGPDHPRYAKSSCPAHVLLGADTGPNPAEYLLHALAACVTSSLVYSAAAPAI